jgi:vitamin B12 transporter
MRIHPLLKTRKIGLALSASLGALAFSSSGFAQVVPDPTQDTDNTTSQSGTQALPQIIVTAPTRNPTPVSELANSITVVTRGEIAAQQQRTLPDVLEAVPGLNVVQTGGPGGLTSVYMRGTNANQTKVLLDGIDVSDPTSSDDSFDFSTLQTADISQIEVLRGPQSGLYGSDAIGGVINISTKTGSGPPHVYGSLEGGSFGTFNQNVGVSGSTSRISYAFTFAHFSSTDSPVTPTSVVAPGTPYNPDSYDNRSLSLKLGAQLADNLDIGAVAHFIETDLRNTADNFDVYPPAAEPVQADSQSQALFTRAFAHWLLLDGRFDETLGIAYTDYKRSYIDTNYSSEDYDFYDGDRIKIDYQGNYTIVPGEIATIGAEHEIDALNNPASWSGGSPSAPLSASVTDDAVFGQLQSNVYDRYFNEANVRFDHNGQFGSAVTFREAPAIFFPETGTKLKGSVGTGFKAPSLDQLYNNYPAYGFYANPNLKPETSFGVDAGFEQSLFAQRLSFGATYYHNDIRNLIEDNDTFTSYINVGHATTQGVESVVALHPVAPLTLRVDYTYTLAYDDDTQQELLRRPKNKVSLTGIWQATDKVQVSGQIVYVSSWLDNNRDGTNTEPLTAPGYVLVNIAGSYDLGHGLTAFARINNLLNEHYQEPLGYNRQGLGVFGGLRLAFDAPIASPPVASLVTK